MVEVCAENIQILHKVVHTDLICVRNEVVPIFGKRHWAILFLEGFWHEASPAGRRPLPRHNRRESATDGIPPL